MTAMKLLLTVFPLVLSAGSTSAAQIAHQLPRADGTIIHYTLDEPATSSEGILVLAQGSGCRPAATSDNLAIVRKAFPAHTALIVEKSGIAPDSAIKHGSTDCPTEFIETYTLSQRIKDYEIVLAHIRTDMAGQSLILFGGSEGGLAMEALAARIHPDGAILLSGAVGGTFGEMVLSTVPPEGRPIVSAGFAEARANPNSTMLSGHTYRFWADILDHRSSEYLMATDTPFLLIYGGKDPAAGQPVRTLADRFAKEGRCNLTYLEFAGLDHSMVDPKGRSHMPEVAHMAASWAERPIRRC